LQQVGGFILEKYPNILTIKITYDIDTQYLRGRRGRDRMVGGFITIYAISA